MNIQPFINDDASFFRWLQHNPTGLFINTYKNPSINYVVLHQNGCRDFKASENMSDNCYTGNQYIKICSTDINDLKKFIDGYGATDFSKRCRHCNPTASVTDDTKIRTQQEYDNIFNLQLAIAKISPAKKLSTKSTLPEKIEVTTNIYKRNPVIVIEALQRANGICECCRNKAPFIRASDETPYLEVHHIDPLNSGGADSIDNVIALCPNCHRYKHYGIKS